MKKKQVRTVLIAFLAVLVTVTAILTLKIEPAAPPADAAVSTPAVESGETADAPKTSEGETTQTDAAEDTAPPKTEEAVPESTPILLPSHDAADEKQDDSKEDNATSPIPTVTEPTETADPSPALEETPNPYVCTIEIRCDTVVDTTKLENQAPAPYVPGNGVILATTEVTFTQGETVFDILQRVTRENKIHMEFREDNAYSGKYIEGINYLYEHDGGPLSGWMYKVNGRFPNYGCAAFVVNRGDTIVWVYTCDLGLDVGDNSTW